MTNTQLSWLKAGVIINKGREKQSHPTKYNLRKSWKHIIMIKTKCKLRHRAHKNIKKGIRH